MDIIFENHRKYDFHDFYLIESFFGWKIKNKKMLGTHRIYNGELKNKIT